MGYYVLFADDEVLVREALKLFLEHLDVALQCTPDAATCLEAFASSHDEFDLVIVSHEMPGMGASDLVPALRRIDAATPIAVTSGFSENEVFRVLDRKLVSGFLRKPYTLSKVRRFLQSVLPDVPVTVLALSQHGARWRGLKPVEEKHEVRAHGQPDELLLDAQRRLASVIVWDLDSGSPAPAHLDVCRSERIPAVFCGKPAALDLTLSGEEPFFFCGGPDSDELLDVIAEASRALMEPS